MLTYPLLLGHRNRLKSVSATCNLKRNHNPADANSYRQNSGERGYRCVQIYGLVKFQSVCLTHLYGLPEVQNVKIIHIYHRHVTQNVQNVH